MKKFIATALTMLTVFSCSAVAFAANETVLTTTVPDATYTLNIPADQEIPFGATSTDIGNVTITNSSGFAEGKNLEVTAIFDGLKCDSTSTIIPYDIFLSLGGFSSTEYLQSGKSLTFPGTENGSVEEKANINTYSVSALNIEIDSTDWGKALAGDYSSTITFTAEVVSSQS